MNAQREEVAKHIYELVQIRAKRKGCRVKKLEDQGARDAVMNGAAWRLILNQQRLGNIRDYIEGNFWYDGGAQRDALIDRALDAARQTHIRASKASGGAPVGEGPDPAAWDDFVLYADHDPLNPNTLPPDLTLQKLEQDERLEAEAAAEDAREQEAAKEFEIMKKALNAYGETLSLAHRKALWWICNEPTLTNSTIKAKVDMTSVRGISPGKVGKIRDHFFALSDKWYLLMNPEDAVETLVRKVETLQKEMAVIRAERRRDAWLRVMSVEEFEAYRSSAFFASAAAALGTTTDALFGACIAPKT